MQLKDFKIGLLFRMSDQVWKCTDVGTRVAIAIIIPAVKESGKDPSWYKGPPYAVVEYVIDENDFPACSLMESV